MGALSPALLREARIVELHGILSHVAICVKKPRWTLGQQSERIRGHIGINSLIITDSLMRYPTLSAVLDSWGVYLNKVGLLKRISTMMLSQTVRRCV